MDSVPEDQPSKWASLPAEILLKIYGLLPLKNLGRCSQVCSKWNDVFYLDDAWRTFTFHDHVLVKRRFTQHAGWQYVLDHMRLRQCIPKIIDKWRAIEVQPVTNLFNLYEFMQKITHFSEFHERLSEESPLGRVRKFSFKWSLHVKDRTLEGEMEEKDIGTGGEVLRSIRHLLFQLHGLKDLELHQLQLDSNDTVILLGELLELFQHRLHRLVIPNLSLYPIASLHLGLFLNLQHLTISPTSLSDNSVILLGDLKHLRTLHIAQDERCGDMTPCSRGAWRTFTRCNRGRTRISLILQGKPKAPLLVQPSAPVTSVVFERSSGQLSIDLAEKVRELRRFMDLLKICDEYGGTLERFEEGGLERLKRSNLTSDRADRAVFELATRCRQLKILIIRERIALGTVVLLALQTKENHFRLYLRKNALLKRTSWKRSEITSLAIDFDWLRGLARDYEKCEEAISQLCGGHVCLLADKRYMDYFQ